MPKVAISNYGITAAEYKVILALRCMPANDVWCHELGMSVIGEGESLDSDTDKAGWGTMLYFALKELGQERGEPDK